MSKKRKKPDLILTGDAEVDAISSLNFMMENLDAVQRARVLDYANNRWHPRDRMAFFVRPPAPEEVRQVTEAANWLADIELKQTLRNAREEVIRQGPATDQTAPLMSDTILDISGPPAPWQSPVAPGCG